MNIQRVLIVDDSEADHMIAEFALEDFSEEIETFKAYDGREALDIIASEQKNFDIIFLDINMPGMNGHEFLEEYANTSNKSAIVVMLTSSDQKIDRDRCLKYAFVKEYLLKPLSAEAVQNMAEKF
jgi:CheY-like chemotaxis protein